MNRLQLETKHYAVIGAFLIALGAQIAGLEHGWRDAVTTGFIGGLIGQIGTIVMALLVGSPVGRDPGLRERRADKGVGV